jgi:hypothetical protein
MGNIDGRRSGWTNRPLRYTYSAHLKEQHEASFGVVRPESVLVVERGRGTLLQLDELGCVNMFGNMLLSQCERVHRRDITN